MLLRKIRMSAASLRFKSQTTKFSGSNLNTFFVRNIGSYIFRRNLLCCRSSLQNILQCNRFCRTPKTGHYLIDPKKLDGSARGKEIKITFVSNTARSMPWKFTPQMKYLTVRPGQSALAFYHAYNPTDREIIGMSTYNIIPAKAAPYFNKIQCFALKNKDLVQKRRS